MMSSDGGKVLGFAIDDEVFDLWAKIEEFADKSKKLVAIIRVKMLLLRCGMFMGSWVVRLIHNL
jgi:hypothetical protein